MCPDVVGAAVAIDVVKGDFFRTLTDLIVNVSACTCLKGVGYDDVLPAAPASGIGTHADCGVEMLKVLR